MKCLFKIIISTLVLLANSNGVYSAVIVGKVIYPEKYEEEYSLSMWHLFLLEQGEYGNIMPDYNKVVLAATMSDNDGGYSF
ncbi:MAG: hypothetical protein U9N73_04750, partial [Candidatus Auribacterota bacterium]|nr:hypothetical protein [Candidatus Auribacterota bacterium]